MNIPRRHRINNDALSPSPLPDAPIPESESTCPNPEVRADLKAYADHELAPLRRARVRFHLSRCPACREELNQMKKISDWFAAADSVSDDAAATAFAPQLRSRVLSRLDGLAPASGGVAPVSVPNPPRPIPLWRKQPALVFGGGGAALAASLAVFFTMNPASHTPNADQKQATSAAAPMPYTAQDYGRNSPVAVAAGKAETADAEADKSVTLSAPSASMNGRIADGVVPGGGSSAVPPPPARAAAPMAEPVAKSVSELSQRQAARPLLAPGSAMVNGNVLKRSDLWAFTDADNERQVHKEASLGLRVNPGGLQATSDKVEELVKSTGGFVASNNLSTDDATGEKSADLTVRVPVKDFESVMAALAKMGNVVSKQLTGEDITEKTTNAATAEQVLVNEAQETAQKLAHQSMSEKRTGQKEAELRQIRMQLAQTRARLGLLRKMAALSTINVSLTEKPVKKAAVPQTTKGGFFTGMQETNHAAMQAFQTAVRVPLVLLIWVLAFSPIWVPLLIAYRWASLKTLASRAFPAPSGSENGTGS